MFPTDHSRSGNAGFSLVPVQGFLLVASAVVAPFALVAKIKLMIASNNAERERLSLLAIGLVHKLGAEEGDDQLAVTGSLAVCRLADLTIEVLVQARDGLIDLNAADPALMSLGLKALGLPVEEASKIALSIVEFRASSRAFPRTEVSNHPEPIGGPKHAPFSELHDILPSGFVTSKLYEIFTVNSKSGTGSLRHATGLLQEELRCNGRGVTDAVSDKAALPIHTIAASVKNATGLIASASYLVEALLPGRVQLLAPGPLFSSTSDEAEAVPCEHLFGADVMKTLMEWRNG